MVTTSISDRNIINRNYEQIFEPTYSVQATQNKI